MKGYLAGFLIIAALGAGYYFFFSKKGNDIVGSSYDTFLQKLKALGEFKDRAFKTAEDVSSAVQDGAKKFEAVKDFFDKAPGAVSGTVDAIWSKIPTSALDFLSNPQKAASDKLSGFIAINGNAATPTKDLEGNICAQFPKDLPVEYAITNPFSPARNYKYSLDWGDGVVATGTVASADSSLFVKHLYGRTGVYPNLFKVTSATSTLDAEIRICVR